MSFTHGIHFFVATGLAAATLLLAAMQLPVDATVLARMRGGLAVAHSHNDYEQSEPLSLALRAGFPSVEADIWWRGGDIVVSHSPFENRGRLTDLYLRPLQDRVDALGSVYGDGRPFYLWIELKEPSRELTDALYRTLARYPMFTIFTEGGVVPGAVTAVLTGDDDAKRRYVDEHRVRHACRDSHEIGPADPPADHRWTWYALPWRRLLDHRGAAMSPRSAVEPIRRIVEHAHRLGRRIRLYQVPEREEAWSAAIEAGVDLIGTDEIEAFQRYLVNRSGEQVRFVSAEVPSLPLASFAVARPGMQLAVDGAEARSAAR